MGCVTGVETRADDMTYSKSSQQMRENAIPLTDAFSQLVQEKREECYVRIQEGKSEPSYQIGAASYTEKEWEKLMKSFDAVQEAIRKAAGLETKDDKSGCLVELDEKYKDPANINILMEEYVTCSYPAEDNVAGNTEEEERYLIVYDSEGIRCMNMTTGACEWAIRFTEASQYEKISDFLGGFAEGENLRFASHLNFWQDFLEDKIDLADFQKFLETKVKDGVPNYLVTTENGAQIDKWSAQYAGYMNPLNFIQEVTLD